MLTVAIEEKIGWSHACDPTALSIVYRFNICVMTGTPDAFRPRSNRQILPSRSPRYALVM